MTFPVTQLWPREHRKLHFRDSSFTNFPAGMPPTPLGVCASGTQHSRHWREQCSPASWTTASGTSKCYPSRKPCLIYCDQEPPLWLLNVIEVYNCYFLGINTGKNNRFPILDILGYLKNTHKNPKFGKVRQVPTREFPTKFPGWDMSHSSKFGIFVGIL